MEASAQTVRASSQGSSNWQACAAKSSSALLAFNLSIAIMAGLAAADRAGNQAYI
jgi:hypothetical protein